MEFEHVLHPRIAERRKEKPPKTTDAAVGFNGKLALLITKLVGSMWCAYVFAAWDMLSLPAAIHQGIQAIVSWVAQTFLQLVLLSIIMVGQNIQSETADRRSEQTYNDAEAILHECLELQRHLQTQDGALNQMLAKLQAAGGATGSQPPRE
ncbi:MAG: hypothetical protein M0Z34_06870 [Nitrospiraceae bacterium]|nr:hypothetical protein [Nitrospiraceae bacterium]MDA8262618.1 hypothetical protein [Actinomycetota bacterium]